MCMSKLAQSRPPSVFPNLVDYGLQVQQHTRSITIFECIFPHSLDHVLEVYLQSRSITASKSIHTLAWLRSWSSSARLLNHGHQVDCQTCSSTTYKCISKLTWSRLRSVSLSSLNCHLQRPFEELWSPACGQFRYAVCRWVAIQIHRYIDENTHWIQEL